MTTKGSRFFLDFGFIRSSTFDFSRPNITTDRVVHSFDSYNSYLAIVDDTTRYIWVLLCMSKEPFIEVFSLFLKANGQPKDIGGLLRCDQGGELARSAEFCAKMLRDHNYKVEPTGADSATQNGGVEHWNDTLAVTVHALLYGALLKEKYWYDALIHAAYQHNRRVH